jgi:hypothetical protein
VWRRPLVYALDGARRHARAIRGLAGRAAWQPPASDRHRAVEGGSGWRHGDERGKVTSIGGMEEFDVEAIS